MASIDDLLTDINVWAYVKIAYLFALFLYIIFAIIVLRQISLMTRTLNGQLNLPLKTIGYIHLIIAIVIFFLGLTVL